MQKITREQSPLHQARSAPIALLVQQRLLHPLTEKASQVKTCEAFLMALQDGLEPTTP